MDKNKDKVLQDIAKKFDTYDGPAEDHLEFLRRSIIEQYINHPTQCGGSFGELLCYEIHNRKRESGQKGLTFAWLAEKWGLSISILGKLIKDHCDRLENMPYVNHDYKNKKESKMEKKYISVPFEIKQLDEEDGVFQFEGFASTFGNTDLDSDVIDRGAFTKSLSKRLPKLLWQHSMDEPLGVFILIEERESGLFVKAKMPLNDTFVSGRVKPQIEIGSVTSMSIGFFIVEATFNKDTEIRTIHEVELFEISLVSIPANPQAVITSFKRADMDNFFKLSLKEQEELFTCGVKFSQRTAKELVGILKHKKNERDAQGAGHVKLDGFLKTLSDDREDQNERQMDDFLELLNKG